MRKLLAIIMVFTVFSTGMAAAQLSVDGVLGEDAETYIVLFESPNVDVTVLEDLGAEVVFDYSIIDGAAVKATPTTAEQIENLNSIEGVTPDIPVLLPVMEGEGDDTNREPHGGEGVVAILDTGVDDNHVDLEGQVVYHEDVRSNGNDPDDYHGHGTHVASILAGTGEGDNKYRGVAPGASVRNYKVLGDTGGGDMSDVIEGVERASESSDIIVMSLGAEVDECDGTDPLSRAVDNADSASTSVVVAAGNEGPSSESVTSPGCAEGAFTVGASEKEESVPDFSSRGPTSDGRYKPDIIAEGVNIMAAEAQTRNSYTSKSGTSMAAPYIAGAVTVLMEEEPDRTHEDYYEAITETAFTLDYDRNTEGYGNVDIGAAENYYSGEEEEQEESDEGSDTGNGESNNEDERNDNGEENNEDTPQEQADEEEIVKDEDNGEIAKDVSISVFNRISQIIQNLLERISQIFE